MKHILVISLLLAANSAMANGVIKNPSSRDCLQYTHSIERVEGKAL